jgi:hypothetical protein
VFRYSGVQAGKVKDRLVFAGTLTPEDLNT